MLMGTWPREHGGTVRHVSACVWSNSTRTLALSEVAKSSTQQTAIKICREQRFEHTSLEPPPRSARARRTHRLRRASPINHTGGRVRPLPTVTRPLPTVHMDPAGRCLRVDALSV